ncbi:MAG: DUF58 domain-containing protein [Candidatus Dormibacteraeota bacterium]|nr:DUF58 domain-containing protein [Candidatus Dormibacteraeota bacterium]
MALGAVVYFYGATSEVAWLFLFGFLLLSAVPVMLVYAGWNAHGLAGGVRLQDVTPSELAPVFEIPERDFRDAPLPAPVFEGDILELELRLEAAGRWARGPARISAGVGEVALEAGTGVVPAAGWTAVRRFGPVRRGPLSANRMVVESADPLGFFRTRRQDRGGAMAVVLPLFTSLSDRLQVREVESQLTLVRAGHGTDLYGVREYRSGDSLRRIHWRTSARRGNLVVREFEPPGLKVLALLLDPAPASRATADQLARLAASEAWDCLRGGGRVHLWAPGLESLAPWQARSIWAVLEWLARWPDLPVEASEAPRVMDAIAFTDQVDGPALELLKGLQERGAATRAWLVGEGELDVPYRRAGVIWPIPE